MVVLAVFKARVDVFHGTTVAWYPSRCFEKPRSGELLDDVSVRCGDTGPGLIDLLKRFSSYSGEVLTRTSENRFQ